MKKIDELPGPQPSFPAGNALDLLGDKPWEVCATWGREYGPVTLIHIFDSPALVLNGPDEIGEVLESRRDEFYKASPTDALRPIVTDACPFILNGEDWEYKRANHPFSMPAPALDAWMATQVAPMRAALEAGLDAIIAKSAEKPVDVRAEVLRLTFDVFSVAIWGKTLGDEVYEWFNTLGDEGNFRMKSPVLLPIISPSFHSQSKKWFKLWAELAEEAKANPDPARTDLMTVVLRRECPLPANEVQAALANIYYGGAYSVSSAIDATLYLMAKHPGEHAKLQREIDEAHPLDERFDLARLERCTRLDHALRESLRYYGPVPMYSRKSLKNEKIAFAGTELPKDTSIYITNWFLHKDPARWKEPEKYHPDRWADGGVERDPIGSGWFFPFGRGPRECVGRPFALFYMKLALATIYAKTKVELDPAQDYDLQMYFGVISPQNLLARFRGR
jgi:cytochrome P450